MRKAILIRAIVVLVAALAVTITAVAVASPSPPPPTITYTGQGMDVIGGPQQQCGASADDGNTGQGIPASGQYLLWILNGDVTGPVTLNLPDGAHQMIAVGGTWKYVSDAFTRDALVNYPVTATFASGSPNNLTVSHGCTGAAASHVVTAIHQGATDGAGGGQPPTGALGSIVHDSATVTIDNNVAIPAGSTVTFTFSHGQTEQTETDGVPSNGHVDPALPEGPLHAGSYGYSATFHSGNTSLVKDSTSANEPLTINQAQLGITTQIHDASHNGIGGDTHVALGSVVHDTATLSGVIDAPGFEPPAVSFTLNGADAGPTGNESATVYRSADSAPLAAGNYSYAAHVDGNADYIEANSDPEPLTVDKTQLQISTTIHDASHNPITEGALGSIVHDTATVTGQVDGFPAPGANDVSFTLNGKQVGQDSTADGTATARTVNTLPLHAGSYTYAAHVNGNDNYLAADSADENLTIHKAQLEIATQIHGVNGGHDDVGGDTHVALGSTVHDTATISVADGGYAGFDIPGVTFSLTDKDGTTNPATTSDATDPIRSAESPGLAAGSYTYSAHVAANSDYMAADSSDEPLTVDKGTLTIVTAIHNASHNVVTSVPNGSVVHDTATVSGQVAGFPAIGDVSFTLNGIDAGPTSTEGTLFRSADSAPLAAGGYIYKASIAESANYKRAVSADEPLSVAAVAGKSMGFWGNQNGIAKIDPKGDGSGYLATDVKIGRGADIDTKVEAAKVLPNQLNACGKGTPLIFTGKGAATTAADCTVANGINKNSLNTAASQTLALGYNIGLIAGFSGQSIGSLGGAPIGKLTASSTVNDAFDYAVTLIDGSVPGGPTTQAQLGALNTLLGQLNKEA